MIALLRSREMSAVAVTIRTHPQIVCEKEGTAVPVTLSRRAAEETECQCKSLAVESQQPLLLLLRYVVTHVSSVGLESCLPHLVLQCIQFGMYLCGTGMPCVVSDEVMRSAIHFERERLTQHCLHVALSQLVAHLDVHNWLRREEGGAKKARKKKKRHNE